MSDILKEAIADAKTVRETALKNAKDALQEAFAPHLKSMLSAKLAEDDIDEMDHGDDEMERDDMDEYGFDEDMHMKDDEDDMEERKNMRHDDDMEERKHMRDDEDDMEERMKRDDDEMEEREHMRDDEDELDELNLEDIIAELEAEINEEEHEDKEEMDEMDDAYDEKAGANRDGLAEEDDAYDETASPNRDGLAEEDEDDKDKEEMDENDVSSNIGSGDNKLNKKAYSGSGIGKGGMKESLEKVQSELNEYKEAVSYLKNKLHEVNVLNAKLLFTNKLFKEYALDKDQKVKVVETMDRAQTTREIKLVYSTLSEAFKSAGKITRKRNIKESASTAVGSTKPRKKIITEEQKVANRFKKLAGIL